MRHDGKGEFPKVLKRVYRLGGLTGLTTLRDRAAADVLNDPSCAERVADYVRCTGTLVEYLDFVEGLLRHPEQVYPDVNVALVESLLRLEPQPEEAKRIRHLASDLLSGRLNVPGSDHLAAVAPLLLLRFADRRSLPLLKRCYENQDGKTPAPAVRAAAVVYSSFGTDAFQVVHDSASKTLRNHLSSLVRLVEKIREWGAVPNSYKNRMQAPQGP